MDRITERMRVAPRVALLVGGALLWLLLTTLPVAADGGPHVASLNNGSGGIGADSCAGCHRAHTAQGPFLIKAANDEALCLTCHGSAGVGATTDVLRGIQYELALPVGSPGQGDDLSALLGALRGGGFDQARLDPANAARRAYSPGLPAPGSIATDFLAKVPVGPAADATSAHLDLDEGDGVVTSGVAWGNGADGSGAGPTVLLTCVSCHNPHGNSYYRTLNPVPNPVAVAGFFAPLSAPGALVTDVPLVNPATGDEDTKNYTVLQVRGTEGRDISYLLYANQVQAAAAAGTFRTVAGIASSDATNERITTTSPHGLATGNSVTISGHDAVSTPAINGTFTVSSTPNSTTFTLTGVNITTGGTKVGTVTKNTLPIAGDYGPTGGDYFHRYVPWNQTSAANRSYDAPNGRPSTFNTQMSAWCTACHTRYTSTDAFLEYPDEPIYHYRHQTVADGAVCTTCHVSHGANTPMTGSYSQTMLWPDGTFRLIPATTDIAYDSRLLKFIDRGTCQACHDPTRTTVVDDYTGPFPVPGVP